MVFVCFGIFQSHGARNFLSGNECIHVYIVFAERVDQNNRVVIESAVLVQHKHTRKRPGLSFCLDMKWGCKKPAAYTSYLLLNY